MHILHHSNFFARLLDGPVHLQCTLCITAMRRVTFSLEEADHLALKLLAIHERKAMLAVVQDAIKSYLESKDAYLYAVTKREER